MQNIMLSSHRVDISSKMLGSMREMFLEFTPTTMLYCKSQIRTVLTFKANQIT